MAKKLILLTFLLPLLIIVAIFIWDDFVSIYIDLPVEKIVIFKEEGNDGVIELDIDKNETYTIDYALEPTAASNKEVSVTVERMSSTQEAAKFEFIKNEYGKIEVIPKTVGDSTIVLTSIDGGYTAEIDIRVVSYKLTAIEASIDKSELNLGEKSQISVKYIPEEPSNTLVNYTSDNTDVATVDEYGVVTAKTPGMATITVRSEFNESLTDTVTVNVILKDPMELGLAEIVEFSKPGSIPIYFDERVDLTADKLAYKITYPDGTEVPSSIIEASFRIDGNTANLDYTFIDTAFYGDIIMTVIFNNSGIETKQSCKVSILNDIKLLFNNEGVFEALAGQTNRIPFTLLPEDSKDDVDYSVFASNTNISVKMSNAGTLILDPRYPGITTVTLTATSKLDPTNIKTATCEVVVKPRNMDIIAKKYGIEKTFTLGGYVYNYDSGAPILVKASSVQNPFKLTFNATPKPEEGYGEGFIENINWHSSTPEVLIDKKGVISFANDTFVGNVEFYASFSYGGVETKTEPYTFTCVADGINVYSYPDLYFATKAEKPVVLMADIKEGFGYIGEELKYETIDTTYDKTYYNNTGRADDAKIKVLIEFKNDLYGNGYVITAHNVTYKLEDGAFGEKVQPKDALFQGPLDFVRIVEENGATVSVKAQDNICFALYEGVTVRNVELRGCDLIPDSSTGRPNLTHLNYVGTTVEVLGDNVTIAYSRLKNGRTVLRAFGDINDSEKKITVNVTNSVLSSAREFIMRVGSNRYSNEKPLIQQTSGGNLWTPPPLSGDKSLSYYNDRENYTSLDADRKATYDENYINTFVNVKNSVFEDAGIFAIGVDSHFASSALNNGESMKDSFPSVGKYLIGWKNLAKTSYGVKLSFFGDVELYNWKNIDEIDSSTLIEIKGNSAFSSISLNVKELINKVSNRNIVYTDKKNETTYVHTGIVFFGGGRNYSVFESEKNIGLGQYNISLSEVGRPELEIAAGTETFRFYLYDASSPFKPEVQKEKLASPNAYDCIKK